MMPHEYDREIIALRNQVKELEFRVNQHRARIAQLEEHETPLNEINEAINLALENLMKEMKQDKPEAKGKKK